MVYEKYYYNTNEKHKIGLTTRIGWIWRDMKGSFYDMKYVVRNYFKWRKIINGLRPWEGFDGLINIMYVDFQTSK